MSTPARRSSSDKLRNGRGHRNYRRRREQLRNRYRRLDLPCDWCGQPFDWTITNYNDRGYFTADHTLALAAGGHLYAQELQGFHKSCNSAKGDSDLPIIRGAT